MDFRVHFRDWKIISHKSKWFFTRTRFWKMIIFLSPKFQSQKKTFYIQFASRFRFSRLPEALFWLLVYCMIMEINRAFQRYIELYTLVVCKCALFHSKIKMLPKKRLFFRICLTYVFCTSSKRIFLTFSFFIVMPINTAFQRYIICIP